MKIQKSYVEHANILYIYIKANYIMIQINQIF